MRYLRFICESLKHPIQVGAFSQSSRFLAKKMAQQIGDSTHVVEFGPGTGPVTVEILKRLPQNGRLTCFEINPQFVKHLQRINDPRLTVINDDALNCERYVDNLECVVSGLPLTLFEKPKREKILDIASKSKTYIQLQYAPFLRKKMKAYFPQVKLKFVPLNLPPAFVFVCKTRKS